LVSGLCNDFSSLVDGESEHDRGKDRGRDLLIVEENEGPPDGTVVVALLRDGEEVTVKKLYREGEMVRLKPQNGAHEDLVILAQEVRLQGRGVHVIHPPG
jgi:repressor LexA